MSTEREQSKIDSLKPKQLDKEAEQVKGGIGPIDAKKPIGPIDGGK